MTSRRSVSWWLSAADGVAALTAFVVAAALRTRLAEIPLLRALLERPLAAPIWPSRDYALFLVLTVILWPLCNRLAGAHEAPRQHRVRTLTTRYLAGTLLCAFLAGFFAFALKLETVSRLFVFYDFSIGFLVLVTQRAALDAIAHRLRQRGFGVRRIVLFGDGEATDAIAHALAADAEGAYEVYGPLSAKQCSRPADLVRDPLRERWAHADEALVVAAGRDLTAAEQTAVAMFLLRGKQVHVVPHLFAGAVDDQLREFGALSIGGSPDVRLRALLRRGFDLVGGIALGIVGLPVSLALAVLVKLDSAGPALFAQERLGRDGARFTLYKLRTMVVDAERVLQDDRELHARYVAGGFKLPDCEDRRVTRIGRILRRTGLDELPQFWNVIRGEMSLVGPRPVVPAEIERYGDLAPLLLAVKPGLTGHWQVSRQPSGYPGRAHLDMEYVLGRSLRGDLAILLRTVPTVLRRWP